MGPRIEIPPEVESTLRALPAPIRTALRNRISRAANLAVKDQAPSARQSWLRRISVDPPVFVIEYQAHRAVLESDGISIARVRAVVVPRAANRDDAAHNAPFVDPRLPLVVYEQTVEGMFHRALGARLTPRLRSRLRQAGLDLDAPLKPAYPLDDWMNFLGIAHEELYAGVSMDEAFRQMGRELVFGFGQTLIGKGVLAITRMLGPRRAVHLTTAQFRTANSFIEAHIDERGPNDFRVWMNEVGWHPTLTSGIFEAGLETAGARDVRVAIEEYDGHACVYGLRWTER